MGLFKLMHWLLRKWRIRYLTPDAASAIMSLEWDKRANENIFRYIDSRKNAWSENEFFETAKEMLVEAKALLPDNVKFEGDILDIGCGVGRISFEFSKNASHVFGVDVSKNMILKAKEYAKKFKISNIDFYVTNGLTFLMIKDNSIDLIYCVRVMQHVPTLAIIRSNLSECARVLSTGGWLIFMTQDNFDPDGKNPTYDGVRCGCAEMKNLTKTLPLNIVWFGKDGALAYFTIMKKKKV